MELKNKIIFLLIVGLILPSFSFVQGQAITPPENLDELKQIGQRILSAFPKIPEILFKIWKEEVLPIWYKMYNWFITNIWSKIEDWFRNKILPLFKKEVEKRKPIIEEEFKQEKKEVEKELPGVTKSFWERFKELIK